MPALNLISSVPRCCELLGSALEVASDGLYTEFSRVLQITPDGQALIVRAGSGWQEHAGGEEGGAGNPRCQSLALTQSKALCVLHRLYPRALILTTVAQRSSDLGVRDYHSAGLFERIT